MYRRSIDVSSGTGQLMLMQARGFEAAGVDVTLACNHGGLKFQLRTGWRARRMSVAKIAALQAERGVFVVDHSLAIPSANVVCVHNLMSEVARHVPGMDAAKAIAAETEFFRSLGVDTPVVANSRLVKKPSSSVSASRPSGSACSTPGFGPTTSAAHKRFAFALARGGRWGSSLRRP